MESPEPPHVLAAQNMASQGNIMFAKQNYKEAIRLFTEAIKTDPQEVRYFGNRGLCLEYLGKFDQALEDAETALSIQPLWTKGYFRKGSALEGLGRFEEAERNFDHLLRLNPKCLDGHRGKQRTMARQLANLGFSIEQSQAAVLQYGSVKTAADSLLLTRLKNSWALSEIFDSDDEEMMTTDCWSKSSTCSSSGRSSLPTKSSSPPIIIEQQNLDPLMESELGDQTAFLTIPKNPLKWPTLWVGNLGPGTTDKFITNTFTKFGKVRGMQLMLDKYCAFITYVEWKTAGEAMRDLQGHDHLGQKLLIKYPDRALDGHKSPQSGLFRAYEPGHSAHRATVILRKSKK